MTRRIKRILERGAEELYNLTILKTQKTVHACNPQLFILVVTNTNTK